jgi:hypothetical protein
MENTNTARNFALQLGSLIALYATLSALIMVVFGVITLLYPNSLSMPWEYESAQQSIRLGIALLVVFFPTYIVVTRYVNTIRRKETGAYMTLTKWLVYLSLLVGGAVLLGDFVSVILAYLNGEITVRFILKALALVVIIGSAFYYYLQDAKGYWITHEKESKRYALFVACVVLAVLVLGFSQSDTPQEVRERKADDQQTMDLQDMQWRIEDHYRVTNALPADIQMLYVGITAPTAPEGRSPYTYKILDADTYELCATFAFTSTRDGISTETRAMIDPVKNPYNNWDHTAGETCFERTVAKEIQVPLPQ